MRTACFTLILALLACGGERAPEPKPKPIPCTIARANVVMFVHWTELEAARGYRDKEGPNMAAIYARKVGARILTNATTCELDACGLDDSASIRVTAGPHANAEGWITASHLTGTPCAGRPMGPIAR